MTEPKRTARTPRARMRAHEDWRPKFLEALTENGVVSWACDAAGVGRSTAYETRDREADFAAAWDAAGEVAADKLEQEAWRRAVDGVVEPVVSAGKHVTDVRRYSDRLLEFLLKARRPKVFADRTRHELESMEIKMDQRGGITLTQLHQLANGSGDDAS